MRTIAYTYTEPTIDLIPSTYIWGLEIDKVYQDIGKRSQLSELISDCQDFTPNYLLIRHLAEFGDNLTQVTQVINILEELGVEIIVIDQNYNSSKFKMVDSVEKKEQLRIIWQEIAQNLKKRTLKQAHAQNRLKILPPPGKAPYGYLRGKEEYIINKTTLPIIQDFFARFLLFGSLRDTINYLQEKYQKKISVSTARYWLTNPVYRGDLIYQNQQIIYNTHNPIISREESAQIDRILKTHQRFQPRSTTANHCLAGLVKCRSCHLPLQVTKVTSRKNQQQYLYLTCRKCPQKIKCKSVNYQEVLQETIKQICDNLPSAITKLNLPDSSDIRKSLLIQIQQKEKLLTDLPNLIQQEIFDQETAKIRAFHLKTEIAQLQKSINQLPPPNLITVANNIAIPQFWEDLSEAEARLYLREFIKQINIKLPLKTDSLWQLNLTFMFEN